MPLDYQQVSGKIREIGGRARERQKVLDDRRNKARELLTAYADQADALRAKVESARAVDANLRCALPVNESLASHVDPRPVAAQGAVLIAADGSQVNPDRHAALQFGVINVGAIVMHLNSGRAPEVHTATELLFDEELETNAGLITEGMVALRRDLKERTRLDELSNGMQGPVVTVTDGPIELWGARDEEPEAYHQSLTSYLTVLSRLQSRGVVTAGYVDKPSADLVVRLLELAAATPADLKQLRLFHPLRGVSDRWLFGERETPLLPPGARSAVFAIQSSSVKNYTGLLALHFFYLNVGSDGHPWPVRVEIPKWVADDPDKLNLLHTVLVEQCRIMGSRPYPYLLHRAHETALVKQEEKEQVEQMLAQELRRHELEVDEVSYKQSAKDLPGRGRG